MKVNKKNIEKYFDRLFPIPRSITGKGYQKSLDIISEIIPLKKFNYKTGEKCSRWSPHGHGMSLASVFGYSFKKNTLKKYLL